MKCGNGITFAWPATWEAKRNEARNWVKGVRNTLFSLQELRGEASLVVARTSSKSLIGSRHWEEMSKVFVMLDWTSSSFMRIPRSIRLRVHFVANKVEGCLLQSCVLQLDLNCAMHSEWLSRCSWNTTRTFLQRWQKFKTIQNATITATASFTIPIAH